MPGVGANGPEAIVKALFLGMALAASRVAGEQVYNLLR